MQGAGFLAIWSDVSEEQETDYLHWLTREHTSERLGIDGFLGARVFRACRSDVRRYFILYDLADARVVGSPAYLERLNAPTPWSRRIMPILGNFGRGGGRVAFTAGTGEGAVVAAFRLDGDAGPSSETLGTVLAADRIAAVRMLETDRGQTSITTNEKSLRARDNSFDRLVLIEGSDVAFVSAAARRVGLDADGDTYEMIFRL